MAGSTATHLLGFDLS